MGVSKTVLVIGGGAAGFFYAINKKEADRNCRVLIWEKSPRLLEKVRISGGGRCNVTHHCFDARELSRFYPRGSRELLGPFTRFGPMQTIEWFAQRGVGIYTQADNRMFPDTDSSETIAQCLIQQADALHIQVETRMEADTLLPQNGKWKITSAKGDELLADEVMIASGPSLRIWEILRKLDFEITPPVPSLFTFNCRSEWIDGLQGVSAEHVVITIPELDKAEEGPLLITHWGLSGPAVLRLSAIAARELNARNYHFELQVNFCGGKNTAAVFAELQTQRQQYPKRAAITHPLFKLPKRLWERLVTISKNWGDLSNRDLQQLAERLTATRFQVTGKSTFKEEFVTCGGVALHQINFKNFSSKKFPNLFFAGEVLDIDALTGGFNFQAAWTGAWLAATYKS